MMSDQSPRENLRIALKVNRDLGGGQDGADAARALNILHEELGFFESDLHTYNFDDATRDRLIAHSRQDAAHAVISVGTVTRQLRQIRFLMFLVVAISAATLLIAWTRL
jgi:hypothetical protein